MNRSRISRRRPQALTLVELLVVLSLVAVLSTVALRSVVGVFEEKQYDANLSQIRAIEQAVLGDGTAAGFLGDIGRLPVARGAVDAELLAELWDQSVATLVDYEIRTPPGDSEVRLGTGWRGPYLNLGINRSELTDGFANPFLLWQAGGTAAGDGDAIAIVQSLGTSGTVGGTSYEEDLEVIFQADAGAVPGLADAETDQWRTDVEIIVIRGGGPIVFADGANLIVRAYGADGSGGIHTVMEQKVVIAADTPSQTFTLSGLPHGATVLRAYQETTDPSTKETAIVTVSPERKSPATHAVIDRFTGTVTLTLY